MMNTVKKLKILLKRCDAISKLDFETNQKSEDFSNFPAEQTMIEDEFASTETIRGETSSLVTDKLSKTTVENKGEGVVDNIDEPRNAYSLSELTDFKECGLMQSGVFVKTEEEEEKGGIISEIVIHDSSDDSFKIETDGCEETELERDSGLEENFRCLSEEPPDCKQFDFLPIDVVIKTEQEEEEDLLTHNLVGRTVTDDSIQIEVDYEEMVAENENGLRENDSTSSNSLMDFEPYDFSQNVPWIKTEEERQAVYEFVGHFMSGLDNGEGDSQSQVEPNSEESSANESNTYHCSAVRGRKKVPFKSQQQQKTLPKTDMKRHKGKLFECQACPQKFWHKLNFKSHLLAHENERRFGCPLCTASFNMRQNWTRHLKLHCVEEPLSLSRYPCPVCPLQISSQKYFVVHMKRHSRQRPFKCSICAKKFSFEQSLKHHSRAHEKSGKPFGCPHCTARFSVKSDLSQHLKFHSPKKRASKLHSFETFKCEVCPEKFSRKAGFKNHLLAHENKRRLKCPHCTASYNIRSNLTRHLQCH